MGIASDPSGNLWIANQEWSAIVGGVGLLEFNPDHITTLPLPTDAANFAPTISISAYFATGNAFQTGPSDNCQNGSPNSFYQIGASSPTTYIIVAIALVVVTAATFVVRRNRQAKT